MKNLNQQEKGKKEKEDNINHLRASYTAYTLYWTCSVWILLFLLDPLFHLTTEQFFLFTVTKPQLSFKAKPALLGFI